MEGNGKGREDEGREGREREWRREGKGKMGGTGRAWDGEGKGGRGGKGRRGATAPQTLIPGTATADASILKSKRQVGLTIK